METTDLDKVLVDTSAWIDFFKKKEPFYSRVLELINDDKICCSGIILAELIHGTRSQNEIKALKDFVFVFNFLAESVSLWEKAGELSFNLRQAGKQVGLADCFLAVSAYTNQASILTIDKHFPIIQEHLDISLI